MSEPIHIKYFQYPTQFDYINKCYSFIKDTKNIYIVYVPQLEEYLIRLDTVVNTDIVPLTMNTKTLCREYIAILDVLCSILPQEHPVTLAIIDYLNELEDNRKVSYVKYIERRIAELDLDIQDNTKSLNILKNSLKINNYFYALFVKYASTDYNNAYAILKLVDQINGSNQDSFIAFIDNNPIDTSLNAECTYHLLKQVMSKITPTDES